MIVTLNEVMLLHELSIKDFGGSLGIRDLGILESAVDRPNATFDSQELYPSPFEKAAAIFESIIKNHPFVDGNKRTAWLSCIAVLRIFEFKFTISQEEAYNFVITVASSHVAFEEIVLFITTHTIPITYV